MSKESCREYANENIEKISESLKCHYAWRWLHMEPLCNEMGGFANFRAFICDKKYMAAIKSLQEKLASAEEALGFYAETSNWYVDSVYKNNVEIDHRDIEMCNAHGGKKAREHFNKYEGEK